jgi:hypothetical protein
MAIQPKAGSTSSDLAKKVANLEKLLADAVAKCEACCKRIDALENAKADSAGGDVVTFADLARLKKKIKNGTL